MNSNDGAVVLLDLLLPERKGRYKTDAVVLFYRYQCPPPLLPHCGHLSPRYLSASFGQAATSKCGATSAAGLLPAYSWFPKPLRLATTAPPTVPASFGVRRLNWQSIVPSRRSPSVPPST